jgi:hypothetical protein
VLRRNLPDPVKVTGLDLQLTMITLRHFEILSARQNKKLELLARINIWTGKFYD